MVQAAPCAITSQPVAVTGSTDVGIAGGGTHVSFKLAGQ
jgi:hypothetical protein